MFTIDLLSFALLPHLRHPDEIHKRNAGHQRCKNKTLYNSINLLSKNDAKVQHYRHTHNPTYLGIISLFLGISNHPENYINTKKEAI